ncbi:tape measure protein [Bacteroides sp.]|uniref:tape measure protein n=1 Tax=Bacteroides sp. TaxID=29523 RepID=UPI0025C09857|nr:tape measure protein [Bacteroides sp.]
MASKLSFSIAINLLTENFKKGTNQVKAGLRAMQMQVLTFAAALGAGGLGLSNFVSRLIDVARETNRVTTALKNVSGGMAQFADNQRFLIDMAKKYGLEINALTGNFAKFTAAASISGMSMMDQRKIFESVSRAVTAFGMSADDSNGVFLALSQMMSKGKISSEELRLQMGERLPIALQAMAKAAGVSVAGLDKLLKQGKLMSADVLPKFAEALNEMIPNVDTDNLETSVNRLKNVFTEFVNGTDAQSKYKALIDWLTEAIQALGDNLKHLLTVFFAAIVFIATNAATKVWRSWSAAYDKTAMSGERASAQAIRATERRIAIEGTLAVKKKAELVAMADYEIALSNGVARDVIAAEVTKEKAVRARIAAESSLEKARAVEQKALDKQKAISATTNAMAEANGFKKASHIISGQIKRLGTSLWAMAKTSVWAMLIAGVVAAIGYFRNLREEANRIRNIFSDYKKGLWSASSTPEITRMQALVNIMNDRKKSQNEINTAQSELQKMLGKENLSQEELNKLVKTRIALLREAAMAEHAFNTVGEYSEKNAHLAGNVGLSTEQMDRLANLKPIDGTSNRNNFAYNNAIRDELKKNGNLYKGISLSDVDKAVKEYIENNRVIADATNRAGKYQANASKLTTSTVDPDDDKKKTTLQKQQESYNKQLEELGAELEIGKITQAEYNNSLGELNIKMFAQAKGTGDKDVLESEYYKNLKIAAEKAVQNQDIVKSALQLEKSQKSYQEELDKLNAQRKNGTLGEKAYLEELLKLQENTAKGASSIKNLSIEGQAFVAALSFSSKMLKEATKTKDPKKYQRDTTFDYKKSEVDILGEELDIAKKLRDDLKDAANEAGVAMTDELNRALQNVDSLEDALKIAQVIEDVKNLKKELGEGVYSGIKDIASSADRLVSSFKNLDEVFDPESEADGWERLMAVWNAMTNVVDSFLSIIKMIENLTEITDKLTKAKEAEIAMTQQSNTKKIEEATIDTTVTGVKVANSGIKKGADISEASTAVTTATTEVAANTAKGVSAVGSSAASLPFPANLIAMGAAIAAAVALFASIPKFANGGIITGGPSSGDKMLARVNAGEMILNQGQQSRLWQAIQSGRLLAGASVSPQSMTTKVRGKDLLLTINNELKSQGKKTL